MESRLIARAGVGATSDTGPNWPIIVLGAAGAWFAYNLWQGYRAPSFPRRSVAAPSPKPTNPPVARKTYLGIPYVILYKTYSDGNGYEGRAYFPGGRARLTKTGYNDHTFTRRTVKQADTEIRRKIAAELRYRASKQ